MVGRIEFAKLIAGLARIVRDVGLAEDLAQDALVAALTQWPESGIPDNPGAWLMATAKHRAIDHLRRGKLLERKHEELASGDIFGFLAREVGADVDLKPLDDKMRLELARKWQTASTAYETKQYHIEHNGLALLVAYLLGGIYMRVVIPPR